MLGLHNITQTDGVQTILAAQKRSPRKSEKSILVRTWFGGIFNDSELDFLIFWVPKSAQKRHFWIAELASFKMR